MFSKKLSYIAVALSTLALAGCSEYSEAEINQFTADQLNRDKQINYDLTRAIQKIDSTVMGTDFTINSKGERVIEIHRSTDSGMVVTSELSKEDSDKLIQAVETQSSSQTEVKSGSSTSDTFMASAGGAITGMLLGQMLMNSMNTTRSANSFSTYRSQNRSSYSSSVANTTRAKAASGGFSGSSRSGSFSSSGGNKSKSASTRSSSRSFSSSGRSSSFSARGMSGG